MSTMVEKAARALHRAHYERGRHLYEDLLWDRLGKFEQEMWMFSARAAIEAMKEPTPKMCNAACAAMSPGKRPTPNRVSHKAKHAIRYRSMIQAALEEVQ